jgi:hypothetical protein
VDSSGSHPDKVKVTANETFELIQEHFVNITKAYKSCVVSPTAPFPKR